MFGFLKKVWRDRRGNALVIAGAALPLIVGAAGLASDTIQWTLWKRQLQRAADSRGLSGVYTRIPTHTQTEVEAAGTHDISLNLHTSMALHAPPTIDRLSNSVNEPSPVRAPFQQQRGLPFTSMFIPSARIIRAVAPAASVPGGGQYCVIGLDPSAKAVGIDI